MAIDSITGYHEAQASDDRLICEILRHEIDRNLPEAESRIWHGHPVWFLDGNPVVGYSKLKSCIRLLFWSGQSFTSPGLNPEGSFKAAERRYTAASQIDIDALGLWIAECRAIQWDYRNIVKNRGRLDRLR